MQWVVKLQIRITLRIWNKIWRKKIRIWIRAQDGYFWWKKNLSCKTSRYCTFNAHSFVVGTLLSLSRGKQCPLNLSVYLSFKRTVCVCDTLHTRKAVFDTSLPACLLKCPHLDYYLAVYILFYRILNRSVRLLNCVWLPFLLLSIYRSTRPPSRLPTCQSNCLFTRMSTYTYVCLSAYQFSCLPTHLSTCQSSCLSTSLSAHLSNCLPRHRIRTGFYFSNM